MLLKYVRYFKCNYIYIYIHSKYHYIWEYNGVQMHAACKAIMEFCMPSIPESSFGGIKCPAPR